MKKLLLTLACASMTVAAVAQSAKVTTKLDNTLKEMKAVDLPADAAIDKDAVIYQGPKNSAIDGVYFRTPAGSMWAVSPRPGYGYSRPNNFVCPLTDFMYENMSEKKDGSWGIQTASSYIDKTDDTDEDNNLWMYYYGGEGAYYAPQYTEGEITYIPYKGANNLTNYCVSGWTLANVPNLGVQDAKYYGGGSLKPYGNLYGAGSINDIPCSGILYTLAKPMANLYVENISLWANVKDSSDPVVGEGFRLLIFNADDENASEPVEILTCTPEQVVNDRDNYWTLNFTKKEVDEISGEEIDVPITIDYKAEMYFLGFDQEDCNINVFGFDIPTEFETGEARLDDSFMICGDKLYRYGNTVAAVCFQATFNKIQAWTEQAVDEAGNTALLNGMTVSEDGQTCKNVYYGGDQGVYVETALDWFVLDENDEPTGEENYWSDDAYEYDWIESVNCDESSQSTLGCYMVSVTCAPLEGEKRYAEIHINGAGCTSEPIYVFQGDYTFAEMQEIIAGGTTAVKNVKNNVKVQSNAIYNLAGQQVNKEFKGVVISNGKKFMNK